VEKGTLKIINRTFKSKLQAIKFAKKWMKEHPKG